MNITVPNNLNATIGNIGALLKENQPPNTAIRLRHINDLVMPRETPENLLLVKPKECVTCKNHVNEQDSCYLVWQDMCFCDTMCLHWYQKQNLIESCSNCFGLVREEIVGKYVFRFDQLLQFCSIPCFHEYQSKRKSCIYCMGKILSFSYKTNPHDPRYCSQDCVNKHLKVQGSNTGLVKPNTPCYICKTILHPITIQYQSIQSGEDVKNICNKFCLQTFALTYKVNLVQCSSCKIYFTPTSLTTTMTQENLIFMFCSKKCETFYVFFDVKVIPCGYCNTKRFDIDLIKRYSKIEPLVYMCSIECYLKRYSASLEQPVAVKRVPPNIVPTLRGPLSPIMENVPENLFPPQTPILSVKLEDPFLPQKIEPIRANNNTELKTCIIVKPEPSPDQKNVATMCSVTKTDKSSCVRPKMFDQSIQTDPQTTKQAIIPIPVPIYVATPMHMFSVPLPCPVPFPLPIPVPIFIPTTRKGAKRILEDIKNIIDKSPRNPEECEVLAIAEALSMEANKHKEKDLDLIEEDVNALFSDDMLEQASHNEMENISKEKHNNPENINKAGAPDPPNSQFNHCEPKIPINRLDERLGIHAWLQWFKLKQVSDLNDPKNTDILLLSSEELANCLTLFVSEVKRPNGKNYAPDTIFYLCLSIQKYLLEHNRNENIFFDLGYNNFVEILNEQMKTFSLLFLDSAFIVTRVEEEHLWESGQLGTTSPFVLLNTVLYNNMKYFKLKTADENMSLLTSSVIIKHENRVDKPLKILRLYKDIDNKYYEMVQNLDNSKRCPVSLFDFYILKSSSLDRQDMNFYLEPEPVCAGLSPIWYSTKPLEKRHLEIMINRLSVVKELNTQIDIDDLEE